MDLPYPLITETLFFHLDRVGRVGSPLTSKGSPLRPSATENITLFDDVGRLGYPTIIDHLHRGSSEPYTSTLPGFPGSFFRV